MENVEGDGTKFPPVTFKADQSGFWTASLARSRQLESPIGAGGNVSPCRGWPPCVPMFNWTLAKAGQK